MLFVYTNSVFILCYILFAIFSVNLQVVQIVAYLCIFANFALYAAYLVTNTILIRKVKNYDYSKETEQLIRYNKQLDIICRDFNTSIDEYNSTDRTVCGIVSIFNEESIYELTGNGSTMYILIDDVILLNMPLIGCVKTESVRLDFDFDSSTDTLSVIIEPEIRQPKCLMFGSKHLFLLSLELENKLSRRMSYVLNNTRDTY